MWVLWTAGLSWAEPSDRVLLDTVLIPGCPCRPDGTLSTCQWQRAIWAATLWERGETASFITSGNAVYNRYIESEGIRAGMIALGVPAEVVYTETQALHSDENASYGLEMMRTLGFERVGVASHSAQAGGLRTWVRKWGELDVTRFSIDMALVKERMQQPLPAVVVEPVPAEEWMPLRERERLIAKRRGVRPRLNSLLVYTAQAFKGTFGHARQPLPPVPEPTLRGQRHRIDTQPWDRRD